MRLTNVQAYSNDPILTVINEELSMILLTFETIDGQIEIMRIQGSDASRDGFFPGVSFEF